MKAILLAAGKGTRLLPLTDVLPKCLIPINGRPLLEYWLNTLYEAKISPVLVNLHYFAHAVQGWIKNSKFGEAVVAVYEDELLGTGGTLLHNTEFVKNKPIMLIHADNLCLANFKEFMHVHTSRPFGTEITMMTFSTPTPHTCGIVEVDTHGVVQAFYEKISDPPGNLANAAIYIIEPKVIDLLADINNHVIDFSTDVLPHYLGKIYTYHNDVYHRDIGTLESLIAAQIEFPTVARFTLPELDAWKHYCEKDDNDLSRRFLMVLAEAMNANVVDVEKEFIAALPDEIFEEERNLILNIHSPSIDFERIVEMIQDRGPSKADLLLYFPKVFHSFSGKEIFDRYSLKSLAFCSAADSRGSRN